MDNIYLQLTREFNEDGPTAILSSGQAVVMHGLAVMSKDGDWILKEHETAASHVLRVLASRGATYRFGAPLDLRWLRGGWSAHFQFRHERLRVRADFVTRPPRVDPARLERMWQEVGDALLPVVPLPELAALKMTNRERDYAVIGELARLMTDPADELLYSRSARDLVRLAERHPALVAKLTPRRPLLGHMAGDIAALEVALDAERRRLMRANEQRLQAYLTAAEAWAAAWPSVAAAVDARPLEEAHEMMVSQATGVLPFTVQVAEDTSP